MKQTLLLFSCILVAKLFFAQPHKSVTNLLVKGINYNTLSATDKNLIDSVLQLYHTTSSDSIRVTLLSFLSENMQDENAWPLYNDFMLTIAEKKLLNDPGNKFFLGIKADALNNKGVVYINKGDAENSLACHLKGLAICKKINDQRGIGQAYNNIGLVYNHQGNIAKAIEYYNQSLLIQEKIDDKLGMAQSLNNIAMVYYTAGEKEKSFEYFEKSLKIRELISDKYGVALSLHNLAYIYHTAGQVEKAISYYERCLHIREEIGDKQGVGYTLNNLGTIYLQRGETEKSMTYFKNSLKASESVNDKSNISNTLNSLSNVYFKEGNIKEALVYGKKSLALANEIGFPGNIKSAAEMLKTVYEKQGDYKNAYQMFGLIIKMRDSINNDNVRKAALKQQMQYEYDKKETLANAEREKNDIEHNAEVKKQRVIIFSVLIGLLLVIVFLALVYNRFKVTQKQKLIIEEQKHVVDEKNKEILDSMHYAQRIQRSRLASDALIQQHIKAEDYFIFYKPKDIVSGDFYWSMYYNNMFYFITADCTGHGVPGAFMSLLNISFLDEVILEFKKVMPHEILNTVRAEIIKALNPEGEMIYKDGMDCVLCAYDLANRKLHFAAANNPLWVISANNEKPIANSEISTSGTHYPLITAGYSLREIKADKMPVGLSEGSDKSFTLQTIDIKKGDIIYTFTDGYADQFGGPKGKKFMYKQLKEVLLSVAHLPMREQKECLERVFEDWKRATEQIDDVLLIGFRV